MFKLIFSLFKVVFNVKKKPSSDVNQEDPIVRLNSDLPVLVEQADQYKKIINESISISSNSKNIETKVTRLELAKEKLAEFKSITSIHDHITFEQLEETEETIKKLEKEYAEKGYYFGIDTSPYRPQLLRALGISSDSPFIQQYQLIASMQLQTPHRILQLHGKTILKDDPLLELPIQSNHGVWLPVPPSLFIDNKELNLPVLSEVASEIGPISSSGGKFLRFLLSIRSIAERQASIDKRVQSLKEEMSSEHWQDIVKKMKGMDGIIDRLFPFFVNSIPKIPQHLTESLKAKGLTNPKKILEAEDEELLSIKGIGPARLAAIKKYCEKNPDYDNDRLDLVERS